MHKQMAPAYGLKAKTNPWLGGLGVVLVHVFLLGVLQSGLGQSLLKKAPVVVVAELITAPEAPVPKPPPPSPLVQPQQTPPPALTRAAPALVAPQVQPVQQALPDALVQAAPVAQQSPAQPPVVSSAAPVPVSAPVRVVATLQASGKCAKPEYPALSRRKEEEGSVQLKFYIGVQGQVLDSQIEKSSGYARLDEAARTALAQCQFKPGAIDGKPEPGWASLKYTWRLD